jgi:hypothetical protein
MRGNLMRCASTTKEIQMATKHELQQQITKITEQLCTANIEISHLRAKLNEADIRSKRLISTVNRTAKPVSETQKLFAMTKQLAKKLNRNVSVAEVKAALASKQGELHV